MSNVHRIMWLDQEIRQHKYPNCKSMAQHFEISLRQANRDLDYLKYTLNAPVRYLAAKRGFTYDDMTFILPNLMITNEERKALNFLAHRYDSFDGSVNSQRIAKLFKNLCGYSEDSSFTPIFCINEEMILTFHKINNCIRNNRKLSICYLESGGIRECLILHPYRIYGKSDNDYLIAYCEEYDRITILRLDRIYQCVEQPQGFTVKENYREDVYIQCLRKKPFKAVILMDRTDYSEGMFGERFIHLEDYRYEVEFYDTRRLLGQLINTNCWTRIVSPDWLIEKLTNQCKDIINKVDKQEQV